MKRVGITGNIGSGKTLVCQVFKSLGIPVFEADEQARSFFYTEEIRDKLIQRFGPDIFITAQELNRPLLAKKLFNNQANLEYVNQLIHPRVRQAFMQWADAQTQSPYVLYEAAILFETGFYKQLDLNIFVTAGMEQRLKRVMQRDGVDEEAVKSRMKHQWPDESKIPMADFVINNDGNDLLTPQVLHIHQRIMAGKS